MRPRLLVAEHKTSFCSIDVRAAYLHADCNLLVVGFGVGRHQNLGSIELACSFIAWLFHGEKMGRAVPFGISRKTGYKILTCCNEIGLQGLTDRSRRPYRQASRLPFQIETRIVRLRQGKLS